MVHSLIEFINITNNELLVFVCSIFLIGFLDELIVDGIWLWLWVSGRRRSISLTESEAVSGELVGKAAVFLATWRESNVIRFTLEHMGANWPHSDLTIYVGCYPNDPETIEQVSLAGSRDERIRLVLTDHNGPTTKADCLNRLYRALVDDERGSGTQFRMIVMHDAEDMVDPAALGVLDRAIGANSVVQLPVLPAALAESRWIGSHYCEEFAEAHAKGMVVRDGIGASLPTAGVGCAIRRAALTRLAQAHELERPFDTENLTEDYVLGLTIGEFGGRSCFVRCRAPDGRLVATRAAFPDTIHASIRQKARWIHGISLQSWDRLGWGRRPIDIWMRIRDRRGPFAAFALAVAYVLVILTGLAILLQWMGYRGFTAEHSPIVRLLLWANFLALIWRATFRFTFTAREYGAVEGLRSVLRIPIANVIAIVAGRRALFAYVASLFGRPPQWDKTSHKLHPTLQQPSGEKR